MSRVWDDLHKKYTNTDWINQPNIFAHDVLQYLSPDGRLLDIGCGQGQDSRFWASKGYGVVATDLSESALSQARAKTQNMPNLDFQKIDISQGLPFTDGTFDVVYAHLSLHYFDTSTTQRLIQDIARVLKPAGLLAFLVNSTDDPEYGQGQRLDDGYFFIHNKPKRFFNDASAKIMTQDYFDVLLCDNKGETYKDAAKGIHNLIRFVGRKKWARWYKKLSFDYKLF